MNEGLKNICTRVGDQTIFWVMDLGRTAHVKRSLLQQYII